MQKPLIRYIFILFLLFGLPLSVFASPLPMLTWSKVPGAVAYELELLTQPPENGHIPASSENLYFSTRQIFVAGYNADLTNYRRPLIYWRVRGLDISGKPLGPFTDAEPLFVSRRQSSPAKPLPTSVFNQSPGAALLYPVYAWIPVHGAAKYEVEILDAPPENPNGIAPSIHRIDTGAAVGFDYYDTRARFGENRFYWRVRGLDAVGNPVGVYSDAGVFSLNPKNPVLVATFGDSITHGGGAVSYPPSDWEYSYQHYLHFDSVNLGKSGDTSQTMLERFEADVLPFRPQYLLILGGINSLRAGVPAADVIANFRALKEACLANNIRPVFLTLPPINPHNIKKIFNEPTAPDWQAQLQQVNGYIRTQVHIDAALGMAGPDGLLPERLAIDGLHLDIEGKKQIAAAVNAGWPRIIVSPWSND